MIKLGKNFEIELDKLISTRMLIQANSGGGKSYAIRKLLEESHGQVQQIIIDLEGEFSTLREKYDYLLVGQDGEIPARIQTAELLARKLLKLNVSTIIDLSELKHHERILFVKRFLDSLVNAPKTLWHPCMVIVDEAHQFCPEKAKSESGSSVIDLCTRGRKRGFCAVLATQRISKLNKDAAAECNNQMVGRTILDIDQKRAADTLGITNKEEIRNLRNMDDGEFQVFGPAIGRDVKLIQVDKVKTIHPDSKHVTVAPIPTPDNIKKIMKDVIDLPKEAETELKNITDYKNRVVELKREVRRLERTQSKPLIKVDEKALERAKIEGKKYADHEWGAKFQELQHTKKSIEKVLKSYETFVKGLATNCSKLLQIEIPEIKLMSRNVPQCPARLTGNTHKEQRVIPVTDSHQESPIVTDDIQIDSEEKPLKKGAMKMLGWLAGAYPNDLTKQKVATLSGFAVNGGTFSSYVSALRKRGWVVGTTELTITEEGLSNAVALNIPSGQELINLWKNKFKLGIGNMLQFIYDSYPNEVTKEEIADATGFAVSGGTFGSYLSVLNKNGLIEVNGEVKISEEFFE